MDHERDTRCVLSNEFDLQPVDDDKRRSRGERLLARANARIELSQICDDATEGDFLTFDDSRLQFAVRHLLLLTTVTAIVVALFKQRGLAAALVGLFVSLLVWGWIYAIGRQRKHDREVALRIRDFKERHSEADLEGLDLDATWSLRNRD